MFDTPASPRPAATTNASVPTGRPLGAAATAREAAAYRRGGSADAAGWTAPPLVQASACLHAALLGAPIAGWLDWPTAVLGLFGNHALLGAIGMHPRGSLLGGNMARLPQPAPHGTAIVGLTFDDGPDPHVTPAVLDLLDRHGATASFFCIGARALAWPGLVREIVRRGHSVENHTQSHPLHFAALGVRGMRREIDAAQAHLRAITGEPPRFFRAPAGIRSPLLDPALSGTGLRYASWNRRGYDTVLRSPDRVLGRVTRGLRGGDIVLLHDIGRRRTPAGRPVVLEVLPRLLGWLRTRDLAAVSLPRALAAPPSDEDLP